MPKMKVGTMNMILTKRKWPVCGTVIIVVAAGVVLWHWHGSGAESGRPAENAPAATVAVAKADREDLFQEVTIPAEFRPYEEVDLHAKVSGYVQEMKVDFGDRVKAGQLLATLEIPELQDDLNHALAAEQRAVADYKDMHLAYTRLVAVNTAHPNLVAQQEVDAAEARDLAAGANVTAARADIDRYQAWVNYSQITAPFDGVITMRYADPGAFIQAGSAGSAAKSLLQVSDNYRLRLDFPVSVAYVKDIHLGDLVSVRVESLNHRTFSGVISRFTDQVNNDTRTMMTEIEVTNQDLELVPGMYAKVVLKTERHPQALAVPIEAVANGTPPVVYVVNDNHQLEQRKVTLGLETLDKYEILEGLHEGDLVVIGNHSEVQAGQKVEPQAVIALNLKE
jgi:RND family efflux transporter MFP subunit